MKVILEYILCYSTAFVLGALMGGFITYHIVRAIEWPEDEAL